MQAHPTREGRPEGKTWDSQHQRRLRRQIEEGSGLDFKSLMHRLSVQRWWGCDRGDHDLSAGEQASGRSTNSSLGPAEAPASAPGGAPSCRATRQ